MASNEMAYQYRLAQWSELTKERVNLGMSIRGYCAMKEFAENTYFYWQRRLREVACAELSERTSAAETGLVPEEWTQVTASPPETPAAMLSIEVNGCSVNVSTATDPELLAKVCRALKSLKYIGERRLCT